MEVQDLREAIHREEWNDVGFVRVSESVALGGMAPVKRSELDRLEILHDARDAVIAFIQPRR